MPGDDDADHDRQRLAGRQQIHLGRSTGRCHREQRRQRDQRNCGQILEQQDRECEPPVLCGQLARLLQHLQRERRRRQRQREPDEQRRQPRRARGDAEPHEHEPGQRHLRAAEPENGVAHRHQPAWPQFEPDHEQQQHDAELGDLEQLVCGVRRENLADPERADQHTGQQIAEHGADAQRLGQRCGDRRRRQQPDHLCERDILHAVCYRPP